MPQCKKSKCHTFNIYICEYWIKTTEILLGICIVKQKKKKKKKKENHSASLLPFDPFHIQISVCESGCICHIHWLALFTEPKSPGLFTYNCAAVTEWAGNGFFFQIQESFVIVALFCLLACVVLDHSTLFSCASWIRCLYMDSLPIDHRRPFIIKSASESLINLWTSGGIKGWTTTTTSTGPSTKQLKTWIN